jgi:hypothetical protein
MPDGRKRRLLLLKKANKGRRCERFLYRRSGKIGWHPTKISKSNKWTGLTGFFRIHKFFDFNNLEILKNPVNPA